VVADRRVVANVNAGTHVHIVADLRKGMDHAVLEDPAVVADT
jgi:hypothetical protein